MPGDVRESLKYRLESVEKIAPPEGMPGDNWHRYIVRHGKQKIEGKKPGSLKDVTQHAETFVENLNARTGSGSGRSAYAARKRDKS